MPNYRLTIEYAGTRYSGWQVQANAPRTVQGILLEAARQQLGEADLQGAGRTDAGVHAAGQVAHLRLRHRVAAQQLPPQLNEALPYDIHVRSAVAVDERFHARHDAVERIYLYQIARHRTAFLKPYVWWIRDFLDSTAMQRGAAPLVGRHDFAAFADRRAADGSTIVELTRCEIAEANDLLLVRVGASHFLWKMVRKLVAALVEVGRGRYPPGDLEALLTSGSARLEPTAPPSGLFLEAVLYAGERFDRPLVPLVRGPSGAD